MDYKKSLLVIALIICILFSISCISASDVNDDTQITSEDSNEIIEESITEDVDEIVTSTDKDKDTEVTSAEAKTFSDLNKTINGDTSTVINLNSDYTYNNNTDSKLTDGIVINRDLTINGNGHTLNGNNMSRIFYVDSGIVVFKNIKFVNANTKKSGGAISGETTTTYINCTFTNNNGYLGGAVLYGNAINCTFTNNYADEGGAVYKVNCENCVFKNNAAIWFGGAKEDGNTINCTFIGNKAKRGGALWGDGNTINCSFTNNSAEQEGGAIGNFRKEVINCTFTGNQASSGGATYKGDCINCTFIGNKATKGGAINTGSAINCTFIANNANTGGAVSEASVNNSVFINNTAEAEGGAIESGTVQNCTFTNNTAEQGGASYKSICENCIFNENNANSGGATYKGDCINCTFNYNNASYGGASSLSTIKLCTYNHNNAVEDGGAIYKGSIFGTCTFDGNTAKNGPDTFECTYFNSENNFTTLNSLINDNEDPVIELFENYIFINETEFTNGIIINRTVTIRGNGHTISGNGLARIFNIVKGDVVFYNITFTKGYNENGGAIRGNASAINCNFTDNYAEDDGGAILGSLNAINCIFSYNSGFDGGAITGTLNASNCTFSYNEGRDNGGVVYGNCTIINSTFNNNYGTAVNGWYIAYMQGKGMSANVYKCIFINNTAIEGGALYYCNATNCTFIDNTALYEGGAIGWGDAINCTFINNKAADYGGAIIYGNAINCTFTNNYAKNAGAILYGNALNCTFTNNSAEYGGAVGRSNVTNCTFINNTAVKYGGAICDGEYIINCTFIDNKAEEYGGAVAQGNIENCKFTNNTAKYGGAVYAPYIISDHIEITNSTFEDNHADEEGGAIYADYNSTGFATIVVLECNFINNTANGNGGAIIYHYGTISDCNFTNNNASSGGAVYCNITGETLTEVSNCMFTGNYAETIGGAIVNTNAVESTFIGNKATEGGATYNGVCEDCIFNENNANSGGAMYGGNAYNSTFTQNNASYGGAIYEGNATKSRFNDNTAEHGQAMFEGTAIRCKFNGNTNEGTIIITPNTFSDLNEIINGNTNTTIYLSEYYIYDNETDSDLSGGIVINRKVEIFGNGITIDGDHMARIFNVTAENVIFHDINFINGYALNGGAIYGESTAINCNFTRNTAENGGAMYEGNAYNCTFIENNATKGGATYETNAVNCNFTNNNATEGQAMYGGNSTLNTFEGNDDQGPTIVPVKLNVSNYTSSYNSGEKLLFNLTADNISYNGFNATIKVYNGTELVGTYYGYTGEGWIVNLNCGKYTAELSIDSHPDVEPVNATITVNQITSKITASAVTTTYNVNKYLTITLKDANGKAIAGAAITVTLGSTKKYTTNSNGQVKINAATLAAKTYTAKITYAGQMNIKGSTATAKVTVKKATPKMTAKAKTYKLKARKKYTVTLKDNKNKVMKSIALTLKINKKTYKAKTNAKGVATFNLKLTKKAKYKTVINYKGNGNYNKVTKTIYIRVK